MALFILQILRQQLNGAAHRVRVRCDRYGLGLHDLRGRRHAHHVRRRAGRLPGENLNDVPRG